MNSIFSYYLYIINNNSHNNSHKIPNHLILPDLQISLLFPIQALHLTLYNLLPLPGYTFPWQKYPKIHPYTLSYIYSQISQFFIKNT